jgi:large subunit ribosomal protein L30
VVVAVLDVAVAKVVIVAVAVALVATDVAVEEADVAAAKRNNEDKTVRVTWIRSGIGYAEDQKQTLRSMGFTRLNQTVERPDTPQFRGQINKVKHLVRVED